MARLVAIDLSIKPVLLIYFTAKYTDVHKITGKWTLGTSGFRFLHKKTPCNTKSAFPMSQCPILLSAWGNITKVTPEFEFHVCGNSTPGTISKVIL
jgi:hypothetical protein